MMVEQFKEKNFNNIHIIDNASSYPKLLYYKNIKDVQVHFMPENLGHRVLFRSINKDFYEKLPNFFILTDPDIKFNEISLQFFRKTYANLQRSIELVKQVLLLYR